MAEAHEKNDRSKTVSDTTRGVEADFDPKSLPGRVYGKKFMPKDRGKETFLSDEKYRQERRAERDEIRMAAAHATSGRTRLGKVFTKVKAKKIKPLSGFAKWGGISIVFTVYLWQLLFGIISLIGFGAQTVVVEFKKETVIGQFIGFFVDFDKYFPGEMLGYIFWVFAAFLAIGTFFVYYLWYHFNGIRPFGTAVGFLISSLALALSILPVTNLFPWLVLWILYVNTSSIFLRGSH